MKKQKYYFIEFLATALIVSFIFSPLATFAQDESLKNTEENIDIKTELTPQPEEVAEVPAEGVVEPIQEFQNEATSTEEVIEIASTTPDVLVDPEITTEEVLPEAQEEIVDKKIKTDKTLPIADQLSYVRSSLSKKGFSNDTLGRIDEFEQKINTPEPEQNILGQFFERIVGNTPEQKEKVRTEKESKKRPFSVISAPQAIKKQNEAQYESLFKEGVERKKVKEKIKDIFNGNTLKNITEGTLSLLGFRTQVIAQENNNPNEYLFEGAEVQFSQSVQSVVDEADGDPLRLFNYVRNTIEFSPYYGLKKGADATLIERLGNDFDQAALLISLLRASNIPARYKHSDVRMSTRAVTELLGVIDAHAAAEVLELSGIPYILFVDQNNNPLFFVIEHVYVEAYVPYGYSRGADTGDAGISQWIPLDPSIKATYYEQLFDVMGSMKVNNFTAESFLENYIGADYNTLSPQEAFEKEVEDYLRTNPSEISAHHPNSILSDIQIKKYFINTNFEFLPTTLPYTLSAHLGTYGVIPEEFKHTLTFTILNEEGGQTLIQHTNFISDIANKEILITYNPATPQDQQIIDSFETIYDVVPLSLVHVLPTIKINGSQVAQGGVHTTLGKDHHYILEFKSPMRSIGENVISHTTETVEKDIIVGVTEAIALDTDRVVPDELRPNQDTQTTSFINAQKLYKTAQNFLYKLENTEKELTNIIGGDFIDIATRATVFNGVNVTYQNNEPYSFEWEGLRIDSSAKVNYFNRFHSNTATHSKEFSYIFGLQASQNESDIFEEEYNIESIATTKGLKLVSQNQFTNTTLFKISSQNEGIINTLTNISENTRNIFRTAVQEGNIIYVPNKPVTYGNWNGLFYININPSTGSAGYLIGEGLNGSYTVEQWPSGWSNFWRSHLLPGLVATITAPLAGQVFQQGDIISWSTSYNSALLDWNEELKLDSKNYKTGTITLKSGYGTNASVAIQIQKQQLGSIYTDFDDELINIANQYNIPPDLLKSVIYQESIKKYDEKLGQYAFQPRSYRYEAHKDYDWYSGPIATAKNRIEKHPEKYFAIGGHARHGPVAPGTQVPPKSEYLTWSRYMSGYRNGLNVNDGGDGNLTAQELLDNNQDYFWKKYKGSIENWNFTAQLLLASSYGLGQVMYNTALTRGFDTTSANERARPITDLFDPEVGIKLTASYLVDKYSGNWFNAVFLYNGGHDDPDPSVYDSVHYAEEVMKRWNNGNGSFKLLIINN